ncbi:putative cytochrome c oxidase assembly protein Cox19 [Jimgerdemannia flammicorona]|uniref:Cytochrome c oxidase assembly protein COX19 n=2 Tax=Jimgerdemannia flammicorona TaxID=994334 RepID=A0A433QXT9_9FUNG|nr:putative cytochrome c oxidase assembly protein Cox19 [Jimgerdemannia flammicorona]RUS34517.1 putative cytochrome c oxidase assembly protein Cox19 [Jimgerdemannia flammicorona]
MSFGRPPNIESFSGDPPALGSFPLDHLGECTHFMKKFLQCLKDNKGDNGACRHMSKSYLLCRMDKGLMAPDDLRNLGFKDLEGERDP